MFMLTKQIKRVLKRKDLVRYLLKSDLKVRYKNKALGFMWAVLDPFFMMLIYIILVSVVFQRGGEYYPIELMTGLLVYKWFSFSTGNNVAILVKNSKLLQTVRFPFSILVINEVNIGLFNFLLGLIVLIPMIFIYEVTISINLLWLPVIIFFQYFFTVGVGLMLSLMGLYFRDLQHIILFLLRIILYLSPVLYNVDFIPEKYQGVYFCINPFASLINSYKNIIVNSASPNQFFFVFVGYTLFFLILGSYLFSRRENNFAKDV